ncbi:LysE family transporter [Gilvimarinus sp. F26214L]|uniref:LysE family transporter n=1 Tax=Gilvimarinus sp. DZF01 TaxID=3461371 RepID=UPI0040453A91
MGAYWPEFLTIVVVHLLAVASPGPDFAIMVRQALVQSRRNALLSAAGIGLGIFVHVSYSLLGIGLLIQQSVALFTVLKIIGATYLAWLGIQALRSSPGALHVAAGEGQTQSAAAAFRLGFFTNVLNPKATLFFVALFSVVISPDTPALIQAGYGLYLAAATTAWFTSLALFFTLPPVRRLFSRFAYWLDRLMGGVLLLLSARLLFSLNQQS